VGLLRNYAYKAGISDTFTQLRALRTYYREAERSLELGQEKNPHYWYYQFRDYAFDNLLAHCDEDLPVELSCHPAFNTLRAHDDAHGTEHVRTLVCYLRNNQSATHAAQELFIHRTSFIRRLAQLEKIARINLDEPDEVLYLLLSAKLLGL
ncbi:MAG: helix-turn-helix domain-containing protein, partial [Eggerthellaceae bacterium]|nr:helix-turn-helix domain-containing protein [Eggerthellaceae bacterium]